MTTTLFSKLSAVFAVAGLLAIVAPQAQAGPGAQVYAPVKTEQAASALKPGNKIAVECGNCGAITLLTVDKDRSILHSFQCPGCQREFRVMDVGSSGKTHTVGSYVLVDKKGNEAHVAVAH